MADKKTILDRVKKYFSLKTNKDLADFLGVSKQTISNWYNRNTIDYEIAISRCTDVDHTIDLKWLLCGDSGDYDWDVSAFQKHPQEKDDTRFDTAWCRRLEKHATDRINTIKLLLEKANYSEGATKTQELIEYILELVEYIHDNSIEYNLTKLYESLKKNEISIDEIEEHLDELVKNDIKLYNMISPYRRELRALSALMFAEMDDWYHND